MKYDKNILRSALLDENIIEPEINELKITRYALDKAKIYAKSIFTAMGENYECYFFMITPKESNDGIVRDLFFPPQYVSAVGVTLDPDTIISSGNALEKAGYKILGWSHSHGNFDTFHSSIDNENIKKVLNEIAAGNYIETKNEKTLLSNNLEIATKGKQMIIRDGEKLIELKLSFEGNIKTKITGAKIDGPTRIGYAYSMVVNAKDSPPYCMVAIKEFCPLYLREKESEAYRVKLKVIEEPILGQLDEQKIIAEIKEKVKKQYDWTDWFSKDEEINLPKRSYTDEEVKAMLLAQKKEAEKATEKSIFGTLRAFGMKHLIKLIMRYRRIFNKDKPKNERIDSP